MRRSHHLVFCLATIALSGHAAAETWYGMDRPYGNEAGCAMDYANPDEGALLLLTGVLQPNLIYWRGRTCILSLFGGDFSHAGWMADCQDENPDLRYMFATWSVENEPDSLRLYGGDGSKTGPMIDLGIIRPCP